tara:strand:- start:11 stop:607 length:597 start_codon:yes stop_codon:yes gene_type:complete
MKNIEEITKKFQNASISIDNGKEVLKIRTTLMGQKTTDKGKMGCVGMAFLFLLYVIFEMGIFSKFPNLDVGDIVVLIITTFFFILAVGIIGTDKHFEITSEYIIIKESIFNRFTPNKEKFFLNDIDRFVCSWRNVATSGVDNKEILEIVFKNEKKHVLWRGNFKAGLDLLDLIQLFLGLEEKVKIGPHNFHLYNKKIL